MAQEITLQKNYITQPVTSIYFGGGTPSIIPTSSLRVLLHALRLHFFILPSAEVTLEANPDDITEEKIIAWKALGINRLSIGIQSFDSNCLTYMNRAHSAAQALTSVKTAIQYGITNLSIDLIYGTPTLSNKQWITNINTAMQLGIQHLSCYALTVEPHTALHTRIAQKKMQAVNPNKAAEQMELLMQLAPTLGLEHYEISNLALTGYRSKHNSSYWQGVPYLGIGPSAHSYNGVSRQWNVSNNALYLQSLKNNTLPAEQETLTLTQQCNETIMTALRTIEGLNCKSIYQNYNYDLVPKAQKYITQKLMLYTEPYLQLTTAGRLRADGIAADLFL